MSFQIRCPKCQSTNVSIETQRTHYYMSGGSPDHAQLHCMTCGKIIFGRVAVESEVRAQHTVWERDHKAREEKEAAERRQKEAAERRAALAARAAKQREITRRLAEQTKAARERACKRRAPNPAPRTPSVPQNGKAEIPSVPQNGKAEIAMSCSLGSCSMILWVSKEQKDTIRATTKRIFCSDEHQKMWATATRTSGGTCAWRECSEDSKKRSLYCSRDCSNKNARWRLKLRKEAEVRRRLDAQAA